MQDVCLVTGNVVWPIIGPGGSKHGVPPQGWPETKPSDELRPSPLMANACVDRSSGRSAVSQVIIGEVTDGRGVVVASRLRSVVDGAPA